MALSKTLGLLSWNNTLDAFQGFSGLSIDKFVHLVRVKPSLKSLELFLVGFRVREWDLMGTEGSLDVLAVEGLGTGPALIINLESIRVRRTKG